MCVSFFTYSLIPYSSWSVFGMVWWGLCRGDWGIILIVIAKAMLGMCFLRFAFCVFAFYECDKYFFNKQFNSESESSKSPSNGHCRVE